MLHSQKRSDISKWLLFCVLVGALIGLGIVNNRSTVVHDISNIGVTVSESIDSTPDISIDFQGNDKALLTEVVEILLDYTVEFLPRIKPSLFLSKGLVIPRNTYVRLCPDGSFY